jgi:quercetin dioxygenase-like cupin family protein
MTSHPGQEFCYVIKGKVEFTLEGKHYLLEKNDSFYFNSNIPHKIKNIHTNTSKLIWVITPPNI